MPLEGKMVCLDTLVKGRYSPQILESLGYHLDTVLEQEFIECRPELEALYNLYVEDQEAIEK